MRLTTTSGRFVCPVEEQPRDMKKMVDMIVSAGAGEESPSTCMVNTRRLRDAMKVVEGCFQSNLDRKNPTRRVCIIEQVNAENRPIESNSDENGIVVSADGVGGDGDGLIQCDGRLNKRFPTVPDSLREALQGFAGGVVAFSVVDNGQYRAGIFRSEDQILILAAASEE